MNKKLEKELFHLLGYLLTAARGLADEPKAYGPLRLIEAASRLSGILMNEDGTFKEITTKVNGKINEQESSMTRSEEDLNSMMDRVIIDYTLALKKARKA